MGAQDEYLRDFRILLTDKGVTPLTDPLQISVYNSLLGGMKRPSDLTAELNLSSSSLHFIIDKMADSGIVTRIKPETDKKTVYYSTNAVLLASSTETNDRLRDMSEKAFVDPLKNYKGLSSLANMLDYYTYEIGLNIDPIRMRYANALADSIEMEKTDFEDAILNVRDVFKKLTGYTFTLFSSSPLTLVLTGDDDVMDRTDTLMQFVIRLVEKTTGRTYKITSKEKFNGSDTMIKVVMDRTEKKEDPYLNTSLSHKDEARFLMVDVDGAAGLMTSDVQIDIIDSIYERPLCITDIVNKVDSPRSTITSNLLRMVEEGVISVFYSESGSAYYGLACSILLKKARPISSDNEDLRNTLDRVKDKEGGFMEGQLLYTLAYLKKLGFDSEYLMVVLGAKYMRATGNMEVQGSFDTYFGNMSDIAQAIGLSLSIVSIYPLTIGISSTDPDSHMFEAMTFIKGMAHQGLEMASSGIFVRSSDEKPEGENISFKEIYPALSMTPVKGVMVENLSPTPTTKKRTSSVKTALLNRSKKENGRPVRTVRYITGIAMAVLAVALIAVVLTSSPTVANTFELSLDDSLSATVTDSNGNVLSSPYSVKSGTVISLELDTDTDIGYVSSGIAYLMEPTSERQYLITMTSDIYLEPLTDVSYLADIANCTFSLCSSSKPISGEPDLIDSARYQSLSKGLYVSENNSIMIRADEGFFLSSADLPRDGILFQSFSCDSLSCANISVNVMPEEYKVVNIEGGSCFYGDQKISNVIYLEKDTSSVKLKCPGDKNFDVKQDGKPLEIDRQDNTFTLDVSSDKVMLSFEENRFY